MNTCLTALNKSLKVKYLQLRFLKTFKKQTPAEYCLDLVRKHDYENFLCTLLLSNNLRTSAFAIRAFNTEIALIEDQVQEVNIGLMRMKFWEEALNNIYNDKPPPNPTSLELHRVLKNKKLSKTYFKRLLEARSKRLSSPTIVNLESLETYAEHTVSSIYYLILEAQGTKDINTDHFASHLGKAHGIVTSIRSVPHNIQKRKIDLPQDILMKHNISTESVFQRSSNKEFRDVIYDVSCKAKQHLDKANSLKKQIKKESHIIFLPLIVLDNYLEKLQRVDFDVFHSKLNKKNSLLPLELYWRKIFF